MTDERKPTPAEQELADDFELEIRSRLVAVEQHTLQLRSALQMAVLAMLALAGAHLALLLIVRKLGAR